MEELTKKQLLEARDWIKECCPTWRDLDIESVDDLTDQQVTTGVKKHFSGELGNSKKNRQKNSKKRPPTKSDRQ